MRAIHRKLVRDLRRHWAQVLSIAAVMACAVMTISGLQSTIRGLQRSRDEYFTTHRFADVFASVQRAPLAVGERVARIPGVGSADLRLVRDVRLDVPGLDDPAVGHVVSIRTTPGPMINEPHVRTGRWISPGRDDEVLVSERFAAANGLRPGDSLGAVLNGRWRRLHITGIAMSPEFVVEGMMGPFGDSHRYGIVWASRALLESAFDLDGAFNDVVIRLAPGASEDAVIAALDRELAPWGGAGAYPRSDQVGMRVLTNEFSQLRTNVSVFSSFFLIVSAFLLNVVLSRLVSAQHEELAALKAFGYTSAEVGRHYLAFAVAAVVAGALMGIPGGVWMGHAFIGIYATYFRFPTLTPRMDIVSAAPGILVGASFALLGAIGAVRRAARVPPAQAMLPESPGRMRPLLIERLGLGRYASPSVRLVFRNLERRPLRTLASVIGVGLAIAILVAGRFPYDVFGRVIRVEFDVAARENFSVQFAGLQPGRAARELLTISGVTSIEPFRTTPVRAHYGAAVRTVVLTGLLPNATLHRLVDVDGNVHVVPQDGAILGRGLAAQLHVRTGDTVAVELLEQGVIRKVEVTGILDEMMGEGMYMDVYAAHALLREGDVVTGAYVAVRPGAGDSVAAAFKRFPAVAGEASRSAMLRTFNEQTSESTLLVMSIIIFSAALIAAGVVYNNARVAVSERGRELGSLRVLGYTRMELTAMLTAEQALITVAGIPAGIVFGRLFSVALATGFTTEQYHFPFVLSFGSQAFAVSVVVGTTALASVVIRRLVNGLDIVEALKTRE